MSYSDKSPKKSESEVRDQLKSEQTWTSDTKSRLLKDYDAYRNAYNSSVNEMESLQRKLEYEEHYTKRLEQ